MNLPHHNRHSRRAVTLIELLVVVTILMLLAAFTIPAMRPLTEGRRIREAVRAIDVFLTQAKTRAIVIQRPVGVILERMERVDIGDPADLTDDTVVYQDDACNIPPSRRNSTPLRRRSLRFSRPNPKLDES